MEFNFVILDFTTDATPPELRPTPAILGLIVADINEQLGREYADAYGHPKANVRVGTNNQDRKPGEFGINLRDTIPEAPGALAYHTVVNGIPDLEIGVDLFDSLTDGADSMSGGIDHEILETLDDAGANGWKDKSNGVMGAEENCDPVQNTYYKGTNGTTLSNFVYPNYFIPGSAGPWDYLGVMRSQDDVEAHGYEIQAASPDHVNQVGGMAARASKVHPGKVVFIHGKLTEKQIARKSHPYARTRRRGIMLGDVKPLHTEKMHAAEVFNHGGWTPPEDRPLVGIKPERPAVPERLHKIVAIKTKDVAPPPRDSRQPRPVRGSTTKTYKRGKLVRG